MTVFLISQVVGLLIFSAVTFSIYCYLIYKKNKVYHTNRNSRPLWYTLSLTFLVVLFICGVSYRLAVLSEGFNEPTLLGLILPQKDDIDITKIRTLL